MKLFILFSLLIIALSSSVFAQLTIDEANWLSKPAYHCIQKQFPYKPGHVLGSAEEAIPPIERHPAFYGCFDWHSSVHGHWTLVRLLKSFPQLEHGDEIRSMLTENLSSENIKKEALFLDDKNNKSFERTYGWAWLLKLAQELKTWDDPTGMELAANLHPLADTLVQKYIRYLPKLVYPIRVGEHTNTAFGLTFAWDYADAFNDIELKSLIEERAREFYLNDKACPLSWEPSGHDFLSPCLIEADLMSRILSAGEFENWFNEFLPGITSDKSFTLDPGKVIDRTDGKLVHLDGLNLSRAWCLYRIADKLSANHEQVVQLAGKHLETALPHIISGDYAGEHWLASFAVYALYSKH